MTGSLDCVSALELLNTLLEHDGRLSLFDVFGLQQFELVVKGAHVTRFWFNWHPCDDADIVRGFLLTFGAIRSGRFKLRHSSRDFEAHETRARLGQQPRLRVPLFGTLLQAIALQDSRFDSAVLSAKRGSDDAVSRWRLAKRLTPREVKLELPLRSFLTLAGPSLRAAPTLTELCRALHADLDWVRASLHALEALGTLERVQESVPVPAQGAFASSVSS